MVENEGEIKENDKVLKEFVPNRCDILLEHVHSYSVDGIIYVNLRQVCLFIFRSKN